MAPHQTVRKIPTGRPQCAWRVGYRSSIPHPTNLQISDRVAVLTLTTDKQHRAPNTPIGRSTVRLQPPAGTRDLEGLGRLGLAAHLQYYKQNARGQSGSHLASPERIRAGPTINVPAMRDAIGLIGRLLHSPSSSTSSCVLG